MFLAFSLFSEPFCNSGISASAAKRLYSLVTRETVVHSHCTRRSKNLIERLFKQVSESNIAVMVQTARHYPAVNKNAEVVAETVAKYLITKFFLIGIGPIKSITVLKVQSVSDSRTVCPLAPFAVRKSLS